MHSGTESEKVTIRIHESEFTGCSVDQDKVAHFEYASLGLSYFYLNYIKVGRMDFFSKDSLCSVLTHKSQPFLQVMDCKSLKCNME